MRISVGFDNEAWGTAEWDGSQVVYGGPNSDAVRRAVVAASFNEDPTEEDLGQLAERMRCRLWAVADETAGARGVKMFGPSPLSSRKRLSPRPLGPSALFRSKTCSLFGGCVDDGQGPYSLDHWAEAKDIERRLKHLGLLGVKAAHQTPDAQGVSPKPKKTTGMGAGKQPGVPFQGPSGRWFVVRETDGRVVPAKDPRKAEEQTAKRSARDKEKADKRSAKEKEKEDRKKRKEEEKRKREAGKKTPEQVIDLAKRMMETPDREGVVDLINGLLDMKLGDMKKVRDALGGEAGGRSKSDLARKIADAVAKQPTPETWAPDEEGYEEPAARPEEYDPDNDAVVQSDEYEPEEDVAQPEEYDPEEDAIVQPEEYEPEGEGADGGGRGQDAGEPEEAGSDVEGEAEGPADQADGESGDRADQSAREKPSPRVAARIEEVNRRIDRYAKLFRGRGLDNVASWMDELKKHVNSVGPESALEALGEEVEGEGEENVVYEGSYEDPGSFVDNYLNRFGITQGFNLPHGTEAPGRTISGRPLQDGEQHTQRREEDFLPSMSPLSDKLEEAKKLPGLESSEDISVIMGKDVTHLTPEVTAKMDERYGKGKWIIKVYGSDAFAGFGIFFPQRIQEITRNAQNTMWNAGSNLAKYGFKIARDPDTGKAVGLVHESGDSYPFGSEEYNNTINGDARYWGDQAASAADNEQGAKLGSRADSLDGGKLKYMAQPAFEAVGISDEERARGVTGAEGGKGEGRTHIVTRNGKAELVPHSTWIKGQWLPVVFEDETTKKMAQAALDAINALPPEARQGQVYAPDIMPTKEGFKVVEANPSDFTGSSGYMEDNPMIIDSYVSKLTGREPAHVKFIRKLLSDNKATKAKRREGNKPKQGEESAGAGSPPAFSSGGLPKKGTGAKEHSQALVDLREAAFDHPGESTDGDIEEAERIASEVVSRFSVDQLSEVASGLNNGKKKKFANKEEAEKFIASKLSEPARARLSVES